MSLDIRRNRYFQQGIRQLGPKEFPSPEDMLIRREEEQHTELAMTVDTMRDKSNSNKAIALIFDLEPREVIHFRGFFKHVPDNGPVN